MHTFLCLVERLRGHGIYPDGAGTPAMLDAFMRNEHAACMKVVKERGIERA